MTNTIGPSVSSALSDLRNDPENSTDLLKTLQTIESTATGIGDGFAANQCPDAGTMAVSGTGTESGIELALERQTASLIELTQELRQVELRLTSEMANAIDAAVSRGRRTFTAAGETKTVENVSGINTPDDLTCSKSLCPETGNGSIDESWAAIRAAMLKSPDDDSNGCVENENGPRREELATPKPEMADESTVTVEFEMPEPFNCDTIEDHDLRLAFLEREDLLRRLSTRLRQRLQPLTAMSTEQIREMSEYLPQDLQDHASQCLLRVDENLRLTELELSLERARLARQMTAVEDTRSTVEHTARQLGYTINSDGTLEGSPNYADSRRSGRRWMRVLGFGR